MELKITCKNCGQHISVDDAAAGQTFACPTCQLQFVVPARDITFSRPSPPVSRKNVSRPQVEIPVVNTVVRGEVQTNVKQGAAIGGWICFALGVVCVFALSALSFFIYGPLFLASFILGIVALAQGRTLHGVLLLLATIVGAPVLILLITVFHVGALGAAMKQDSAASKQSDATLAVASGTGTGESNQRTIAVSSSKYPALDEKNGFRDFKLGTPSAQISGISPIRSTALGEEQKVELANFDKRLGDFEISDITLTFDGGLLKAITVRATGKQNVEGLRQTLIAAYGQPKKEMFGDDLNWNGEKVSLWLWFHKMFTESATAHFSSKEVEAHIKNAIEQRAKENAAAATKGL